MSVNERIKIILSTHRITASEFAEKLGIQRSAVSHLLSGRNKPSLDVLEKILTHYPRVNAHWLITGETDSKVEYDQNSNPDKTQTPNNESDIERVIVFYKDGQFKEYRND